MYSLYSRDLSHKVKSVVETKMKRGRSWRKPGRGEYREAFRIWEYLHLEGYDKWGMASLIESAKVMGEDRLEVAWKFGDVYEKILGEMRRGYGIIRVPAGRRASGENIYYHQTLLYSLGEAALDGGRCFTSTPQTKAKAVREIEKSYNFVYA